jgi:hypothetical protein
MDAHARHWSNGRYISHAHPSLTDDYVYARGAQAQNKHLNWWELLRQPQRVRVVIQVVSRQKDLLSIPTF